MRERAPARLRASMSYWLATTRPDGRPHSAPVRGVLAGGEFWFGTTGQKVRNLRHMPCAAVHCERDAGVTGAHSGHGHEERRAPATEAGLSLRAPGGRIGVCPAAATRVQSRHQPPSSSALPQIGKLGGHAQLPGTDGSHGGSGISSKWALTVLSPFIVTRAVVDVPLAAPDHLTKR